MPATSDIAATPGITRPKADVRFARYVFRIAGVWGIAVLSPLYFLIDRISMLYPPLITHPDFYYGFIGVGLAWQGAFLLIGNDPARFRPMMIAAIAEKFIYVISLVVLFEQGQLRVGQAAVAVPDFLLGILFIAAFFRTGHAALE